MLDDTPVGRSFDDDSFIHVSPIPQPTATSSSTAAPPRRSYDFDDLPIRSLAAATPADDLPTTHVLHSTGFDDEEEEELEQEMPSSSFEVLGNDSDLLSLLAGASVSLAETESAKPTQSSNNEELIELYSTIAALKRENAELQKDVELAKKSKDAQLVESQQRHEQHAQRLKVELHEQQQVNASLQRDYDELRGEFERTRNELDTLLRQRDELEQQSHRRHDDSAALRGELQSLKGELNKLRMESARSKNDFEDLLRDKQQMGEELQELRRLLRDEDQRHEDALRELQGNLRRLEEINLAVKNELAEKTTHIGRMTTDWMALERNFKHAVADVDALKHRNAALEASERELQQTRYQVSSLENDYRDQVNALQGELSALRQQLQQQQYSRGAAPPTPPAYREPPLSSSSSYAPLSNSGRASYAPPSSAYGASPSPSLAQYSSSRYEDDYGGPVSAKYSSKLLSSALGDRGTPSSSGGGGGGGGSSLALLLQGRRQGDDAGGASITGEGGRRRNASQMSGGPAATPFATEKTSEMLVSFDHMERDLTRMMTEKTALSEESERLQVRGLKSLADRTRMQKIEARLSELSKDISSTRKRLSGKPA